MLLLTDESCVALPFLFSTFGRIIMGDYASKGVAGTGLGLGMQYR